MSIKQDKLAWLADTNTKIGGRQQYQFNNASNSYAQRTLDGSILATGYSGAHSVIFRLYYQAGASTCPFTMGAAGVANNRFCLLYFDSGTGFRYYSGNGANNQFKVTGITPTALAWQDCIVTVSDARNLNIDFNGSTYSAGLSYQPVLQAVGTIDIMGYLPAGNYITGIMNDLAIYDRVIDANEIALFKAGGIPHSPLFYVPCYDGAGSVFKDTQAAADLTLYNGSWESNTQDDPKVFL